jgi:hypothetical protein
MIKILIKINSLQLIRFGKNTTNEAAKKVLFRNFFYNDTTRFLNLPNAEVN